MNGQCTKEVPISFSLENGKQMNGFLETTTNIIRKTGTPEVCSLTTEVPVSYIGHDLFLYNGTSGVMTQQDVTSVPQLHIQ